MLLSYIHLGSRMTLTSVTSPTFTEAKAREVVRLASTTRTFLGLQIEAMGIPTSSEVWQAMHRTDSDRMGRAVGAFDSLQVPQTELVRLKELLLWIVESFPTTSPNADEFISGSYIQPFLETGYSVDAIDRLDEALTTAMFLRICYELPVTTDYQTQKEIHRILLEGKVEDLHAKIVE
jgi:hypothetical protein